ncbi:hypothetical protein AC579_6501 [Pseudocercospora musae]|uniref:Uncharacterized protein n=1 Tax=Pseudocercospora musae TaxID=113226 RepID=A0A139I0Y3_9PEZI|nr:hypothetical protein AC579_6501 [Pseudocercospora musae]
MNHLGVRGNPAIGRSGWVSDFRLIVINSSRLSTPGVGEFSPVKTPEISDVHRSELGAVNDFPAVLCEMLPYLRGKELRVDFVAAVHLFQRGSAQALVQCLKGILWAEVWEKPASANSLGTPD